VKLQRYYYWVRSVGSLGKLAKGYGQMATGITGTVPAVPANVVAVAGATAAEPVVITWAPVATATSYGIYRADTADGLKTHLGDVLATADPLQATDSAIAAGEDYHYFVTAKLAQMESGFSDRAEAIIP
jgi:hypothetical protein